MMATEGPIGEMTRRRVLGGVGAAMAVSAAAGCDLLSTTPAEDERTPRRSGQAKDDGVKEAPSLQERTKSGELPPLKDRLPVSPLVIEPVDAPGEYGGTWTDVALAPTDMYAYLLYVFGYDSLVRWDPQWAEVVPNLAESFNANDTGTEYTFELRQGVKWSDGEPFTADDIVFAVADVFGSEELYPTGPPAFVTADDGQPAEFEKLDDYTIRVTFPTPSGLFLQRLATPDGRWLTEYPRHYAMTFHPKYASGVEAAAKQEGFSEWGDYFKAETDGSISRACPRLHPWVLTTGLETGTRAEVERNPYYWKVDPQGRQLPYLDRIVYDLVTDREAINLKTANGEFDFPTRYTPGLTDKPVLARNREQGQFGFVDAIPGVMNEVIVNLNLSHEDPALRAVFNNKDFRIGLSHAINREEMISVVLQGQGVPWQVAPRAESMFYDEDLATQYLDYDVDKANEYLDRAGYVDKDGDGFRLRPDGERISFAIDFDPSTRDYWAPAMELIRDYWRGVGIDVLLNPGSNSLWLTKVQANRHDAAMWLGDGGLNDAVLSGWYYVPYQWNCMYGVGWATWYSSGGESGVEPPAEVQRQYSLYEQVKATADEGERRELFGQVLDIAREQFYAIGTMMIKQSYWVVRDDFHNVRSGIPQAYAYATPGPSQPEQYFKRGGAADG